MAQPPTNIRALQGEQILELTWPAGRVDRLPYARVRGECPCAVCIDEWTGAPLLDQSTIPSDIKLEGMEPVGGYAVRFSWSDGHSSGLYTWEALERMGPPAGP